jgi:hypothetical protein
MGAVAELPAGAPLWPRNVFSAHSHTCTRAWHRQMLRKFDPLCKDSDPRVAEGDTMSNMMLWLDMGMISAKLDERRY